MIGNAETSVFLKDGISEWHILKLVWQGEGGRASCFGVFFKGSGT